MEEKEFFINLFKKVDFSVVFFFYFFFFKVNLFLAPLPNSAHPPLKNIKMSTPDN